MTAARDTHVRFEGLDVLRGFAAVYVMLSHYTSFCLRMFGDVPFHIPRETGDYAVWLFFMISGFVIFFTVERSETWKDFAISRVTRLYPVYWFTLTMVVALETHVFWNKALSPLNYLANMTMFQEFMGVENNDIVYWSLTIEVAFYLIIGLLFKLQLLRRIDRVAWVWLAIAGIAGLADRFMDIPTPMILTRYLIVPYVPFFLLGIMLYLNRMRGFSAGRGAIIVASFAVVLLIHGPLGLLISLCLYALAVFSVSAWGRYLVTPVFLWLGAISYSLYLVHRNLGYTVMYELHKLGWSTEAVLLLVIVCALVGATLLTYLVERPLAAWLRGWFRRLRRT